MHSIQSNQIILHVIIYHLSNVKPRTNFEQIITGQSCKEKLNQQTHLFANSPMFAMFTPKCIQN